MLVLAALAFVAPVALATDVDLVKNTEQSTTSSNPVSSFIWDHLLPFTTGGSSRGYILTAVDLAMQSADSAFYRMQILDASGTSLGTLNNPSSLTAGLNRHTATGVGIDLAANTTYQIFIDVLTKTNIRMQATTSAEEDAAVLPGWSIADIATFRNASTHPAWGDSDRVPKIAIRGRAKDTMAPMLAGARVDGSTLTLIYNEPLDMDSTPATSDFTVSVAGTDQTPSTVVVSAAGTVKLTLGTAVTAGQTVRVSYTAGTNPIRNHALIDAADFSGKTVTNTTGVTKPAVTSTGVAIVSSPTNDTDSDMTPDTYHLGALIKVQLTFTKAVTVIGTPRLKIKLDPSSGEFWANYESGSGTKQLTFAYRVVSPNMSTQGIAVLENTLQLNGGVIESTSTKAAATLDHGELAHDANHKVNSNLADTTVPTLESARVYGATLTLNYNEPLDTGSTPATTDFTVSVAGTDQTPSAVVVYGTSSVALILGTAATAGQVVTVSYTAGTNPIRDTAANNAANLDGEIVTNIVAPVNPPLPSLSTELPAEETALGVEPDTAPSFGTATVDALALDQDRAMRSVVLPQATGGNGALSYQLTSQPAGLAGLSFDPLTRTLSGTPGTVGNWTFILRADDADDNRAASDAALLGFEVTVIERDVRMDAVKRTLAGVAIRTMTSALSNLGTRLGSVVPVTGLTLGGQSFTKQSLELTGRPGMGVDSAGDACASDRHDPHGFGSVGISRTNNVTNDGCEDQNQGQSQAVDIGQLLYTSTFSYALGEEDDSGNADPAQPRWAVWGRGDASSFAGRPGDIRYDGDAWSAWLGVDARQGPWVAGLALSHGTAEADYSYGDGSTPDGQGRLRTTLTALYPYGRWTLDNGLELRGVLGAGTGEARHTPEDDQTETSNLKMRMVSAGVRQELTAVAGVDLAARADASVVRLKIDSGPESISGVSADSWRVRVGLEASREYLLDEKSTLVPFIEAVGRRDGGDGLAGTGLEMAGGARWQAPGVQVEARGWMLAAHTEDGVRERGVSVTARVAPGAHGRGLSLVLMPRWGATPGSAEALWQDQMPHVSASDTSNESAIDARIGYGIAMSPAGVLTPFAETSIAGSASRRLRLGTRFDASMADLSVEFAGERYEQHAVRPEHAVRLDLRLLF